ncbi:MAG: SprT-like domain-containing protein [Prevotella nanceiensis]|nr:SprT-like domain-containing protein [Hoylesella nanceiensis]
MTVNIEWIAQQFELFNALYFDKVLPTPLFLVSKTKTKLGWFVHKKRFTFRGFRSYDYKIGMSTHYQFTERQAQNILLHEMIHFYIAFKNIKDKSAHGPVFKRLMNQFNQEFGWELTVSVNTKDYKTNETASSAKAKKIKERLILAIEQSDGTCFLSVVNPRYALKIQNELKRTTHNLKFSWYKSSDEKFSHFSTVRSLRGVKTPRNEFEEVIKSLQPVVLVRKEKSEK